MECIKVTGWRVVWSLVAKATPSRLARWGGGDSICRSRLTWGRRMGWLVGLNVTSAPPTCGQASSSKSLGKEPIKQRLHPSLYQVYFHYCYSEFNHHTDLNLTQSILPLCRDFTKEKMLILYTEKNILTHHTGLI